ncbi:cytochrome c biogenesis protein ResB [Camelliibacillus cellulosilyticus]|uniref:cytochrome c biogenesis protein ResB n=1 Tax=Camelliibacillus cellulosilyticus TaxID=2174486 RepID=UPI00366BC49F
MKREIICECGHRNPNGTILCEACGKPLDDDQSKTLLNMRYEGGARRSQTYKRTPIDKIWNYFSSVKVGVTLIILVLIAAAIGTILPQDNAIPSDDPKTYYPEHWGAFGSLYVKLGLDHLYTSWWWVILVGLLGLSIIVASIDRFIPLYRGLKNQRVTRHERFLNRQRLFGRTAGDHPDETIAKAKSALKEKRYRIREENGNLLAEKGRFSRWGPYVNHIGLIIVLISGVMRFIPGTYVNDGIWIPEGEKRPIPGTNGQYYLSNHQFILQTYDKNNKQFQKAIERVGGNVAKNFQTNATLYKAKGAHVIGEQPKLQKIKTVKIRVNHPMTFGAYKVYQSSYRMELYKMRFKLIDKKTNHSFGTFNINLSNPKKSYDLGNGYKVQLEDYLPDLTFDKNGTPTTKTNNPNNPAFVFNMITPDKPKGEKSFVAIQTNLEPLGKNKYKVAFDGLQTRYLSGLTVHKNLSIWVAFLGAIIFLIGVGQGMYWNHRRIWIQRKNGELWVAAHTNKNWLGIKRDIQHLVGQTGLNEPVDQLEQKTLEQDKERGLVT